MTPRKKRSELFLIDGLRTPVGSPFRSLKDFNANQLAALVIQKLLSRCRVRASDVNQVILGNTVSAGTGQNLAREAALKAGFPSSAPAFVVNNVCGAGLQSVICAAQAIFTGDARVVLAGGSESATRSPYLVDKDIEDENVSGHLIDSLIFDGLRCPVSGKRMGELSDFLAAKYHIPRQEQDVYALESHRKALKAQKENRFAREVVPVKISGSAGKSRGGKLLAKDDRPRRNLTMETLQGYGPVFNLDGTATAGNSSVPCDGAAAVLLASAPAVKKLKVKPVARLLGYASVAVDPQMTFAANVPAIRACLKNSGLSLEDIDLFEIGEAFAVPPIVTARELEIPAKKVNIYGGDLALGHPLGSAGTRMLVTLLHALRSRRKKRGLASICLGGGGAIAVAIEKN